MYSNRLPAGFLPLFSHSLLLCVPFRLTLPPPHLPNNAEVSDLKSEVNKSVSLKGRVIIPLPNFFFFGGSLTARPDQISQFAMETTQKGASNYWREAGDARGEGRER